MQDNTRRYTALAWSLCTLLAWASGALGQPPPLEAPRISETQLTLRHDRVQAQGTVVAKAGHFLTIETAAHFLADGDAGKIIAVQRREGFLRGRIATVARNPEFKPTWLPQIGESVITGAIGVDSAVVVMEVVVRSEEERLVYQAIKPANFTPHLCPNGQSRILSVHIVDQFGQEHVVRAANHLNPRCLAWGRGSFYPKPGDSGSGVFLMVKAASGEIWPVLIGNVAQADERGGIATLTYRAEPWVGETLARSTSRPGLSRPGVEQVTERRQREHPASKGDRYSGG